MKTASPILSWMSDSLQSFIAQLSLSKGPLTVEAYKHDVLKFLEYLTSKNVKKPSALNQRHIIDYLGEHKLNGKSDASIHRYYMAIRSYCRHMRRAKVITAELTEDITPPKNSIKAPRVPTVEEVTLILEQPNVETESGLRDRAILELLYSSGLRASELCSLQLHHIGATKVMVCCGKRSKTRTVPITQEAFTWIDRYVVNYRGNDKGPLFQTKMGKAIRRQLLCAIVSDYSKKAQVEGVTTHTLRHACATHLLDEGADLRLIQEVLGHSSIASTQRYTHLSSSKMQEMFQTFHPRKKKDEKV